MNNIPKEILDFANSTALGQISEKIGNDNGLLIDQIGELDAQIRHVLRGFSKSQTFTQDLMKYLEIDRSLADKITVAVNAEVFQKLKDHMQKSAAADIQSIEKAGGFSLEPGTDINVGDPADHIENQAHLIDGIEHPVSGSEKISRKETSGLGQGFTQPQPGTRAEPLVDQLLKGSVAQPQQTKVTPPPPTSKGPDAYREPIS